MLSCNLQLSFFYMKTYLRNETILTKNAFIGQIFKIEKGHVKSSQTNTIYTKNDYLFIDQILYNPYAKEDYIAQDLVVGEWIDRKDITIEHFKILSRMYQDKSNHNELLLINDSSIRLARYLLFEYKNNKTLSFYLTHSVQDLSNYLKINKKDLSLQFKLLEAKKIISRHNKLLNILNEKKLEDIAYLLDYNI